jgi:hypothetical protein
MGLSYQINQISAIAKMRIDFQKILNSITVIAVFMSFLREHLAQPDGRNPQVFQVVELGNDASERPPLKRLAPDSAQRSQRRGTPFGSFGHGFWRQRRSRRGLLSSFASLKPSINRKIEYRFSLTYR